MTLSNYELRVLDFLAEPIDNLNLKDNRKACILEQTIEYVILIVVIHTHRVDLVLLMYSIYLTILQACHTFITTFQ